MATLSIPKNYADGTVLFESDLDDISDAVETMLNTTKLNDDNLQDAGITASSKLIDASISTAKLADNAVTQAKRAALGQQLSSDTGTYTNTTTSFTDITNASITITTTGRPVFIGLQATSAASAAQLDYTFSDATNTDGVAQTKLLRDSTEIAFYNFGVSDGDTGNTVGVTVPPSTIWFIDTPTAGTYTYKLQGASSESGNDAAYAVRNCKLIAYEL